MDQEIIDRIEKMATEYDDAWEAEYARGPNSDMTAMNHYSIRAETLRGVIKILEES